MWGCVGVEGGGSAHLGCRVEGRVGLGASWSPWQHLPAGSLKGPGIGAKVAALSERSLGLGEVVALEGQRAEGRGHLGPRGDFLSGRVTGQKLGEEEPGR